MDTVTYSVCDRARSSQISLHPGGCLSQTKSSSLCKSAMECMASGQGKTRRKLSLEWTYLGKNCFSFSTRKKPNNPFPTLKLKNIFFLMTHDNCQSLNLQTLTHSADCNRHHEVCFISVTLAHWDTKHKTEWSLWVIRASREQTSLKPNFCPQQTKILPPIFQYVNINTGIILSWKWASKPLRSYSPTWLELQKDI